MTWPICSGAEFAKALGVSRATITHWADDGMPVDRSRKSGREMQIDPLVALPWVVAQRGATPGSQRERLSNAQAEKVEMENARRRGQLIEASQVQETIFGLAAYLAREHDALPGRVANELASIHEPAVIRSRLLVELRSIRDGIAEHSARTADACEHLADECEHQPPATESDRERVGGSDEGPAAGKR